MTGHSSYEAMSKVRWADAEVKAVAIDYDSVCLSILESDGETRTLRAVGYIGYKLIGFWDEIVVERAEMFDRHPFIDECTESINRRLGTRWLDSGNEARNRRSWFALIVHLSDGSAVEIAAAAFVVLP
jgi:hypothetical protein